ncbi:MAG TPA: ABC transporter permease [Xanthobacteraceae bacterium]|nr:ABC transporter permease [Xanthobacteraceae bacterium]
MAPAQALRRYFGILGALLRREEESRRQSPFDSIVNLLEPVFLILLLSFLFYALQRRQVSPLGGPPILYYATGFFPIYFFIYVSRRMRGSIDTPGRRFPIEQRLDHVIVHVILRIIDYSFLGILLFGGIYLFSSDQAIPQDITKVVASLVAIVGLGFGWGVLNLVLSRRSRIWNFIFPTISRILVLFSGVFFVPDFLTPDTRYVLGFNPLMHAVQLFRLGFYPQYTAILLDVRYLAYFAICAVLLGLMIERVTRRFEGR